MVTIRVEDRTVVNGVERQRIVEVSADLHPDVVAQIVRALEGPAPSTRFEGVKAHG